MDQKSTIAWLIVSSLLAALLVWGIVAWRRSRFTLAQAILCFINLFFARILWRGRVSGPLPIRPDEGAVIVCNHSSGVDPLVIQLCTNRVVHWMVAREYVEMPVLSLAFKAVEAIPVNRGGIDTASTKAAIRLARQGGLVGLFPEGRVNVTGELLLPGRPGAALIALKARVKVIPCYIRGVPYDGTALGSMFMLGRAEVVVGEAIDISPYFGREGDRAVLQELTWLFLKEIAKLAGRPDFEPQLAQRAWTSLPSVDDPQNHSETRGPETVSDAPTAAGTSLP